MEESMVPCSCSLKLLGGIGDISGQHALPIQLWGTTAPWLKVALAPWTPPGTAGLVFTAEAPEVTNIRKAPQCPGTVHPTSAPACSHTRTCPEPTVRKGEIHLGTARLL